MTRISQTYTTKTHTIDAFHRGRFHLSQSREGHRAGLDALLLAATVNDERAVRYADFGSGSGAVGCAIAARLPHARVSLVENDPQSLRDAAATLALPQNASFADRVTIISADLSARGAARRSSGLAPDAFDHVLTNPPFDPKEYGRPSPIARKATAHVMATSLLQDWSRTAAATLRHGGTMTMILRPANLPGLIAAWVGRFSGPSIRPIHTSNGPATRILVRGRRGTKEPLAIHSSIVLRENGEETELAKRIATGKAVIEI